MSGGVAVAGVGSERSWLSLDAAGRAPADSARLQELSAARRADRAEFLADCGKFEQELAKETRMAKFTSAELEEVEQSLERLRRWHRGLAARDVFGVSEAAEAAERLRQCAAACDHYAEQVLRALHGTPGPGV